MGFVRAAAGLWLLVMTMAAVSLVLCSARVNTISLNSVNGEEWVVGRRSLLGVRVDDYSDPSANRGHDPPSAKKPAATKARPKTSRRG